MKTKRNDAVIWHVFLILFTILIIYPVLFGLGNSFKPLSEAYQTTLNIIPKIFTVENYQTFFDSLPVLKITMNTFIIASVSAIVKLITSFLAAYALVFFKVRGKEIVYFLLISTIFIPFTVTMIPNYFVDFRSIGLNDSIWGVILPQLADAIGIFLITQSMRGYSNPSLIEVAAIGQFSHGRIMRILFSR